MDHLLIPGNDAASRAVRTVLAQFDGPAYLRRARRLEAAIEQLHEHCGQKRCELLDMVKLRLGVLHALAGGWAVLVPWLLDERQASQLERLHAELRPELRLPVAPSRSRRRLRAAYLELGDSMARFHARWFAFLRALDLSQVNDLIQGYNRWYVLEKECVVGSHRIARQGFVPLAPITVEQLSEHFPPLLMSEHGPIDLR